MCGGGRKQAEWRADPSQMDDTTRPVRLQRAVCYHRARLPPSLEPSMSTGRKTNGGENRHVLPKRVKRTILGAHRHGEEEEEGRALGEPYAHFYLTPHF